MQKDKAHGSYIMIRKLFFYTIFFVGCCISSLPVFAQNIPVPVVSGAYPDMNAEDFISKLERQTGFTFYYDKHDIDSVIVDLRVQQEPLPQVLKMAFANKGIGFSISGNIVFISKGAVVHTKLPEGFYPQDKTERELNSEDTLKWVGNNKRTPVQTANTQNKIYVIGESNVQSNKTGYIVTGYVLDEKTGEPLPGTFVRVENSKTGTTTDQYGYYTIELPKGRHTLSIQSIGMRDARREIEVNGDGKLNIEMESTIVRLKRVIISAEKVNNIRGLEMGVQQIDIQTVKKVPVAFGEPDVLRVVLTMPGVKSVGEASTGLNVRGGATDQNLILFNDATIYNPSHFFGLFSAFNPEIIQDVELYKSSIPAKYGSRLSSVLEITGREGNKKNFTGTAGIGLLTSRLTLEGPLKKGKSSFIIGGRTTYANWLLNLLPQQYKHSRASFFDINAGITHEVNKKNSIYFTGYMSGDHFNLNSDTSYHYANNNVSLKWKHIFNSNLYGLLISGFDNYNYDISSGANPVNAYSLAFNINQANLKARFNYFVNSQHSLEFGLDNIFYKLHPGIYKPLGKSSLVQSETMQAEQGLESALYLSDKYTITPVFSIEAGIRYSMFNVMGADSFNVYPAGVPKTIDNIISTKYYEHNKIAKTYQGPEARLSARYEFDEDFSIKAGFNMQRQYIHLLSNTTAMAPTDIWQLSNPNIKPQYGEQYSIGFYKNFKSNTIETSLEFYYKKMKDYLDYKNGAVLVLNPHIETDVLSTKGKAYGVELLVKKPTGKLNGWISYSYSRTFLRMNDSTQGALINEGRYYPANSDIPNAVTLIGNYRIKHRFSVSLNATYSTGRPITLPIGRFYYDNSYRTLYSDRNAYRIPDYFRADFSLNLDGNYKVHQKTHGSWTVGVYNVTGIRNPYSVYFVSENGVVNGYKLSIFGSAIPFINYNIKF